MSDEFDLNAILRQAQHLQEQLMSAQADAADQEVEGQSGGGVVRVTVTGAMEFRSIRIAPEVVDPADVEMLEDLVLAAVHDAVAKAQELQQGALGGFDLGSLGLGDLAGPGGPAGSNEPGGLPGHPGLPGSGGPSGEDR